jgi:hypothetical protein
MDNEEETTAAAEEALEREDTTDLDDEFDEDDLPTKMPSSDGLGATGLVVGALAAGALGYTIYKAIKGVEWRKKS